MTMMMQVGFPTYELPATKISSKPKAPLVYRVCPKLESGYSTPDLSKVSLVPNGMKDGQTVVSFPTWAGNGFSLTNGRNTGNAERPLMRRVSNSLERPSYSLRIKSSTGEEAIPFRTHSSRSTRPRSLNIDQINRWPSGDPAAFAMSHKLFPVSNEICLSDPKFSPSVQSIYTNNIDTPKGHSFHHSLYTQPSIGSSAETINTLSWSNWSSHRKVTATAEMCPIVPSKSSEEEYSMSYHPPLSNKTDCASSSDISAPAPVKGILKSSRQSSRAPSLEDGENSGSNSTSKSFSSYGSKKRVKFLETDAVASVPYESRGHVFSVNSKNTTAVERNIIDGYNSKKEFSLVEDQTHSVTEHADVSKPRGETTIPDSKTKQSVLPMDYIIDPNSCKYKTGVAPLSEKDELNHVPNAFYKNGRVFWSPAPVRDTHKTIRSIEEFNTSSNTTVPAKHLDTKSDIGTGLKVTPKFASLPRRSKSKHPVSPSRFSCAPQFSNKILLAQLPTDSNRKTFHKYSMTPTVSEKENSNLAEVVSRVSLKGSKGRGKGQDHKTRLKHSKQGGNFCSEEKTLRIMEWLDTVHSQRETKRGAPVARHISAK